MEAKHTGAQIEATEKTVKKGGAQKYHAANSEKGKLFCRERIRLLVDEGSFVEDGLLANVKDGTLPADGVVTGLATIDGRTVAIMANDSTVKAGSWGRRTVEKILRIQETAERQQCPLFYLVDSAGARITDQVEMFPGRRGAGRIFYNEVQLSGQIPQICLLFGPSAAGGAYIPAFCDVTFMVDGNASMYLGSPRMAEMVIGEKVTLEEMGGAKMHCSVSGCGDFLCKTEQEAIELARKYFAFFPQNWMEKPDLIESRPPGGPAESIDEIIPKEQNKFFDIKMLIDKIVDEESFVEVKKRFAKEIVTGLARIGGIPVGIIANQPKVKGGVLFVDSADKAARFIWLCDAFNIPLLYLADVPGFMIGTKVEREGIIRAGAKMIAAVSEATVPRISVIVRKAYGAGLYAMCGPGFEPDVTIALPQAMIAVMGPEAAVNAVFANKIAERPEEEREAYVAKLREEYAEDVDIVHLASEQVVDDIVPGERLRQNLIDRFTHYFQKEDVRAPKKHCVYPV
ncbi:MAG: acyl-CoA carboxylase subunit beta [Deltaproteobacteria bacterium]|nr:acyl-CoA carboxylase subunit beta [Deltaproteobacteria bacterium]